MQNPVVEFVKENSSRESEAVRRNLEAAKNQAAIDAARKEQLLQARLKSKEQADQRARIVEQKLVQRVEALNKAKAGTKVSPLNFNQPPADKSQRISIQTNQPSLKAPLNFDIRNMRRPEAAPPNAIQISKQTALPQSSQSVAQPQIPASFKRAPLVIPTQPPRDAAAQNVIDKRNYVSPSTSSSPISGFIGPKTVSTKTYSESKNDYNPLSNSIDGPFKPFISGGYLRIKSGVFSLFTGSNGTGAPTQYVIGTEPYTGAGSSLIITPIAIPVSGYDGIGVEINLSAATAGQFLEIASVSSFTFGSSDSHEEAGRGAFDYTITNNVPADGGQIQLRYPLASVGSDGSLFWHQSSNIVFSCMPLGIGSYSTYTVAVGDTIHWNMGIITNIT